MIKLLLYSDDIDQKVLYINLDDFTFSEYNLGDYAEVENDQMRELLKKVLYKELGDILDA